MLEQPLAVLVAEEEGQVRGEAFLVHVPIDRRLIRAEHGREVQGNGFGGRGVPLDGLDPVLRFEFLERGPRKGGDLDRELTGVHEAIEVALDEDLKTREHSLRVPNSLEEALLELALSAGVGGDLLVGRFHSDNPIVGNNCIRSRHNNLSLLVYCRCGDVRALAPREAFVSLVFWFAAVVRILLFRTR